MKKIIFPLLMVVLIATCLYPVAWFAWRANQPMTMPEYNGLTFVEFEQWRQMAFNDLATKYQVSHPNVDVKFNVCYEGEIGILAFVQLPMSGYYTLAAIYPKLQGAISARDRKFVPEDTTWTTFMSSWWDTTEKFMWVIVESEPQTSVVYCRLQPNVPTPEEFETMQVQQVSVETP